MSFYTESQHWVFVNKMALNAIVKIFQFFTLVNIYVELTICVKSNDKYPDKTNNTSHSKHKINFCLYSWRLWILSVLWIWLNLDIQFYFSSSFILFLTILCCVNLSIFQALLIASLVARATCEAAFERRYFDVSSGALVL